MTRRLTTSLAAAALLAGLAAGCGGGDDEGPDRDLAELVPSDAQAYFEGEVNLKGDLGDSIDPIASAFPGGDDASDELIKSIEEDSSEDDQPLDYSEQIEPWLGERAAFWFNGVQPSGSGESDIETFAALVETTDSEKALDEIRKATEEDGDTISDEEYNGTGYEVIEGSDSSTGEEVTAFTSIDGLLVLGNEDGLRATIDQNDATDSVLDSPGYADVEEQGDTVFSFFVDGKAIVDSLPNTAEFGAQERQLLEGAYGDFLEEPVTGSLEVEDKTAAFEFSSAAADVNESLVAESPLLASGFADSWAAFGLADIGQSYASVLNNFKSGIPQGQLDQINAEFRRQTGIDFNDLATAGDVAFFAAGESLTDLQVGGVVEMPDAAARNKVLAALRKLVQSEGQAQIAPLAVSGADDGFAVQPSGFPVPINVAVSGDKVIIAGGDPATEALIAGDGGLTSSDSFTSAQDALGEGYNTNFFVEFAPILSLVESTGQDDDPDFQEAKPYLEALDVLAYGAKSDGGRDTVRYVLGVNE